MAAQAVLVSFISRFRGASASRLQPVSAGLRRSYSQDGSVSQFLHHSLVPTMHYQKSLPRGKDQVAGDVKGLCLKPWRAAASLNR